MNGFSMFFRNGLTSILAHITLGKEKDEIDPGFFFNISSFLSLRALSAFLANQNNTSPMIRSIPKLLKLISDSMSLSGMTPIYLGNLCLPLSDSLFSRNINSLKMRVVMDQFPLLIPG